MALEDLYCFLNTVEIYSTHLLKYCEDEWGHEERARREEAIRREGAERKPLGRENHTRERTKARERRERAARTNDVAQGVPLI